MTAATTWTWLAAATGAGAVAYAALLVGLAVAGRRTQAAALARFIPDLLVLFSRLARDARVPRRRKAALLAGLLYLATPIDLVPDFVPVAGQLDDAIVAVALLRYLLRGAGPGLLTELWPGPPDSLRILLRLAARSD